MKSVLRRSTFSGNCRKFHRLAMVEKLHAPRQCTLLNANMPWIGSMRYDILMTSVSYECQLNSLGECLSIASRARPMDPRLRVGMILDTLSRAMDSLTARGSTGSD